MTKAFKLPADQYGKLPTTDQLDALKPSRSTTFTAVGYGLQQINPVKIEAEKIRMFAEPHLVQIDGGIVGDFSLLLSNNASTGGTCFGDSGGPNFVGGRVPPRPEKRAGLCGTVPEITGRCCCTPRSSS